MKKQVAITLLLAQGALISVLNAQNTAKTNKDVSVLVTWVDTITGDFSFAQKWEYAYNITRNKWGELHRWYQPDMEPPGLFEPDGHIKKDSIAAYYKNTDTTHYYYNIYWESDCFSNRTESPDVLFVQFTPGNIFCTNTRSGKSNCKFRMNMGADSCHMNSTVVDVLPMDDVYYNGVSGYIKIDQHKYREGIIKAEFYFDFRHPYNPDEKHFWKGRMYVKMRKDDSNKTPVFVPGGK